MRPVRVRPGALTAPYVNYTNSELNAWLAAGYAVMRTDYQGLGTPGVHPYLVGESEGRSVLDIIRAARDLDSSIGKRFLIAGHSQGGQAALFAAGEANSWTPDLKLRGDRLLRPRVAPVRAGGAPPQPDDAERTLGAGGVHCHRGRRPRPRGVNPW